LNSDIRLCGRKRGCDTSETEFEINSEKRIAQERVAGSERGEGIWDGRGERETE